MKRALAVTGIALALVAASTTPAMADAAKPGTSMTHIKTTAGLASALEGVGVVLYAQGGATSGLIGDSPAAAASQVVFHVPVTSTAGGVQHLGSMLVLFNTKKDLRVQLQNPVIDFGKGVITATVPQAQAQGPITVLKIIKAGQIKPTVTTDRKAGLRTTAYTGVQLRLAPGIAEVLNSLLGLPEGSLADKADFATADVTLYSKVGRR